MQGEKGMVVGMSLYSQIREAYVSGKSIMSNYIIQIRLPDFKCTGKFHFSIILSLASSHKKIYIIRSSPLSILAYSFIKNTVTNILSGTANSLSAIICLSSFCSFVETRTYP